jgi:hypothetical protein
MYAKLQTEAYVPGAGSLGTTFPSNTKTLENLSMVTHDTSLSITFTYRGIKKELLVPHTNVVLMDVAPEESPKSPSPAIVGTLSELRDSA